MQTEFHIIDKSDFTFLHVPTLQLFQSMNKTIQMYIESVENNNVDECFTKEEQEEIKSLMVH